MSHLYTRMMYIELEELSELTPYTQLTSDVNGITPYRKVCRLGATTSSNAAFSPCIDFKWKT